MYKFILQNNNMKSNNEFYNKIKGTAMRVIFAPTYVTFSMAYFKIKNYSVCTFKYEEVLAEYISRKLEPFFGRLPYSLKE